MAKFNIGQIIKKGDAKQRILLIIVVVLVLVLVLLLLSKLVNFGKNSTGTSQVSRVPNISSVQGGKVSPEYERALNNNNIQKAADARSTGTSAIPTIINTGESSGVVGASMGCTNCCNTCGGESTDQLLGGLLNTGKISSSTADLLNNLANQNLSPEDYEAALAQMVRDGKISPEEARRLLAAYKKNYQDKIAAAGAKDLDPLVKQGALSVSAASTLLDLQKQPASPEAYDQALATMVNAGQMSAQTADLLRQKYQQQQAKRLAEESAGQLLSLQADGSLSAETAGMLSALQASGLSVDDYASALDKLVREGKLTPEEARRLLAQYKKQHGGNAEMSSYPSGMELSHEQGDTLKNLQRTNASVDSFATQLEQYARAGEISADTASRLLTGYQAEYNAKQAFLAALNQAVSQNELNNETSVKIQALMNDGTPLDQFSTTLNALNTQGLLSTAQVTTLTNNYTRVKTAADAKDQLITTLESKPKFPSEAAQTLSTLRDGSASLSDYASELQRMVDAGLISPETARMLLEAYKKQLAQKNASGFATNGKSAAFSGLSGPAIDINLGSSGNAKLDRVSQAGLSQQATTSQQRKDYTAAVAFQQQNQQAMINQQAQIQQLSDKMYAQAQQLFTPLLTPTVQTFVTGGSDDGLAGAAASGSSPSGEQAASAAPIIKAGTVLYGVLDTAVDSDYAESPVMATVVAGPYKGAKLLGSIKTVKDGQRVMLTFNLMTMNDWPKGIAVNAFAIDPDSARSAVATSVDNHYMLRYGTAFAASFLQGLGQAVQTSGTTVSSDSGVVTESTSDLNTQETILVALGQVGQNASTEVAKLQNTPPTVKVKAGIGIGILFMSDVSDVKGATNIPETPPAVQN